MLDITRSFRIIGEAILELELGKPLPSLSDIRFNILFGRGSPNPVAAMAMIDDNYRLVKLDNSLSILESLVLIKKIELEAVPPYLLRQTRLTS